MSISPKMREMRDFVDALRQALGKAPLYYEGPDLIEEKFLLAPVDLPASHSQDWLRSAPAPVASRESFRQQSVNRAERRKALRFEGRDRP
jgi:hypothetical protein